MSANVVNAITVEIRKINTDILMHMQQITKLEKKKGQLVKARFFANDNMPVSENTKSLRDLVRNVMENNKGVSPKGVYDKLIQEGNYVKLKSVQSKFYEIRKELYGPN